MGLERISWRRSRRPWVLHLVGSGPASGALDKLPTATPTDVALFPKPGKAGPELVEGNRNNALNELIFRKAQGGQTEFGEQRATALAAGPFWGRGRRDDQERERSGDQQDVHRKDATALEGALAHLGISVRYNIRAQSSEVSSDGGQTWERTSDRKTADLRRLIADGFSYRLADNRGIAPLRYGLDSWGEHLNPLLYHHETDPFLDWLQSLPVWGRRKETTQRTERNLASAGWAVDPMGKYLLVFRGRATCLPSLVVYCERFPFLSPRNGRARVHC